MHIGVTVVLLLATVTVAVVPAFGLLYVLRSLLPEDPHSFYAFFFFLVQTVVVWVAGFFALFLYADLSFPIVMNLFGRILCYGAEEKHNAEEKTIKTE